MSKWQPIETYPQCDSPGCTDPECDWGPEVLLLMPTAHGPVRVVGHKEAGMWLSRDAGEHVCWGGLEAPPSHWAQLPEIVKDVHSVPGMIIGQE